jgi:FkbM family methyltransferase
MNWNEVEIVIPSVLSSPGRADSLRDLITQISQQCPGVWIGIFPQHDPRPKDLAKHAFDVLPAGFRDFSRPWVILIEDDVVLSPEFGTRVLQIIESVDDTVGAVSFFSPMDESRWNHKQYLYEEKHRPFAYTQCVAMRKQVAEHWGDQMMRWYANKGKRYATPDLSFGYCCDELDLKIMISLPSMVQHLGMPSAFKHSAVPKSHLDYRTMLITKSLKPKVILHVGASEGNEASYYHSLRPKQVIWIEPIPVIFRSLENRIAGFREQKAFKLLVSNKSKRHEFTISSHRGISSSIFRFEPAHSKLWPAIFETKTVEMTSARLDDFLDEQGIAPDTVVLDVEGAELLALEGMGSYLDHVRNLVVEYTTIPVLRGGVLFDELNEWITKRGFELKDRKPISADVEDPYSFGDALYVRV